jgi:hypothetical protein
MWQSRAVSALAGQIAPGDLAAWPVFHARSQLCSRLAFGKIVAMLEIARETAADAKEL